MIIRSTVASAIFLLASGLAAHEDKKDDQKDDQAKLQGEWEVVSMEFPNQKLDKEALAKSKLVVKDNEWMPTIDGREYKFTFTLDTSKSPKELDLVSVKKGVVAGKGTTAGSTWQGIYKIDGDSLTFCRSSSSKGERPTELKAGENVVFIVYKRAAK